MKEPRDRQPEQPEQQEQQEHLQPPAPMEPAKHDFFYFDLSDESHKQLVEEELEEAVEYPLTPVKEVTKVDY